MQAFRKKYHLSMAQIPFFKNPFHIEKEQFPFLQELALGGIHILHNRKKTILITFFISICIAGIPLSILLLIQRYNCRVLKQTVSAYEAEQNAYVDTNVYLLSKALPAGEALTKDDLTPCTVKTFHAVNRFSMLLTAKI